jgi:exodeoxyribonuclease-3
MQPPFFFFSDMLYYFKKKQKKGADGLRRLVSWNVNGIRSCMQKGFAEAFASFDADVVCLQETRAEPRQVSFDPDGYRQYWNCAAKRGYSGTAVFCREMPEDVRFGLGIPEHDNEGRVVTLEFADFFLVNVYTPNAKAELARLDYRMAWEDAFRAHLLALAAQKAVIVCGDMNVAHNEIDLANPASNHFSAGFSDEERAKFGELLAAGFTDSFRYLHPDERNAYSWWSFRTNARARNVGWRIDYFLTSRDFAPRIARAAILRDVFGSDHCPILLEID